jgi:hypothetical protein
MQFHSCMRAYALMNSFVVNLFFVQSHNFSGSWSSFSISSKNRPPR